MFFSKRSSLVAYLYEVKYGERETDVVRFTGHSKTLTYDGLTYPPQPVQHADIVTSGSLDNTTLDVRTSIKNPLTNLFKDYPPSYVVTLKISRVQLLKDPEVPGIQGPHVIWFGRILACSIRGLEASFSCELIGTAVKRPGLRRNFQLTCPHVLYGPSCKATPVPITATVTGLYAPGVGTPGSLDDPDYYQHRLDLTIDDPGAWPLDWRGGRVHPGLLYRGWVEWTHADGVEKRGILSNFVRQSRLYNDPEYPDIPVLSGTGPVNSLSKLAIDGPPKGLQVGSKIQLYWGCNHKLSGCDRLHNNVPNFGGQPWIPETNPTAGTKIHFY